MIDEYEFVVQPRIAGHGPTLFAGLSKPLDLKLVSRLEFGSGAVAMRYEPSPRGAAAGGGKIAIRRSAAGESPGTWLAGAKSALGRVEGPTRGGRSSVRGPVKLPNQKISFPRGSVSFLAEK